MSETMSQASSNTDSIKLPQAFLEEPKQLSPSASAYFENYLKDLQAGYGRRNQKAEIIEPESLSDIPSIAQAYKFRDAQAPQQSQFYQSEQRRPLYDINEPMIPSPSNQSPSYDSEGQETRADISQYVSPPRDLDENGFTSIGMSVEDAFKKYFPASKNTESPLENAPESSSDENENLSNIQNNQGHSSFSSQFQFPSSISESKQQQQHHQQQGLLQHQQHPHQASSTQYFETVQVCSFLL